jgi:hypothetical protein
MKCASCRTSCYEDLNRIKPSSIIACRITKFLQFVDRLVFFQEHIVSELELFLCSGKSVGTHVPGLWPLDCSICDQWSSFEIRDGGQVQKPSNPYYINT